MTERDLHWVFLSRLAIHGAVRPTQRERTDAITRLGLHLSTRDGRVSLSGLARNEISVSIRVVAPSIAQARDTGTVAIRRALEECGLDKWYEPTNDPRFPKVVAR